MATQTTSVASVQSLIASAANSASVDLGIALGVAQVESNFNQNAISSAGAIGVFQLLPSTAAGLGVNPLDLQSNIQGGIAYLGQLYNQFGNWGDALAAYNWGPGNVQNAGGVDNAPASVQAYASQVLSLAAGYDGGAAPSGVSEFASLTSSLGADLGINVASLMPTTALGYAAWGVGLAVVLALVFD